MASNQSEAENGGEKMGRSRRRNWFIEYCCCCCKCCCSDDDANRPLLHGTTPKELSPVAPATNVEEEEESGAGEETQQVELVVAEIESEGQKTPDIESDVEQEKVPKEDQEAKTLTEIDLEPTVRARVESGTFVRGSGQRASWRLVPSVTKQVKEAMEEQAKEYGGKDDHTEESGQNEDSGETAQVMTFVTEDGSEEGKASEDKKPLRHVTLVAQDVEDDEGIGEESVTMTFTIGSRGNQEVSANGDMKLHIVSSDGQTLAEGVELADSANQAATSERDSYSNNQTTTPIITHEN